MPYLVVFTWGRLACLSLAFAGFCVCPFFPFGVRDGLWDVIVLIPDHCLSI